MYQYIHDPLSFRLSTWPWGGASYITTFNYRVHNIEFKPLLDYLKQELEKSPTLKVRYTTFSLVNVYSGFTDMAYGLGGTPHKSIRRGPIVFTFAMTRRDRTSFLPRHVIWNTGHTCLWGPTLQYGHDYLTISVPINIAMKCRLNNTLRRQLEWLYKIVGGWSKSFAMRRDSIETQDAKMIHDKIYYKTIPKVMWNYPWGDWKYVREFWDRAPNLLDIQVTDLFVEYFLLYLTRYFKKVKEPLVVPVFEEIEQYVRSGLLDLVQKQTTDKGNLVAKFLPSDIALALAEPSPSINIEAVVDAICNGKRQ